jgi:RND family efflux transporter MFP subunit
MASDSAALLSAESTANAYQQMEDYLTIRAPFNGRLSSRMIDPGDFVSNGGNQILFVLENPARLRLRVHVPEAHVENNLVDKEMIFSVDAIPNKTFRAILSRKSGSINRETRTELWEYEFDNLSAELKPGMYATTHLHLTRPGKSFVVPFPAVVTSMERKFVIRIKDDVAEWIDVREGFSLENGKEIFGSLQEGDIILARGSEELKPGTRVLYKTD